MLPVSLSYRAKFEQSLTMNLCKKSENIPGSYSSEWQAARSGSFVWALKDSCPCKEDLERTTIYAVCLKATRLQCCLNEGPVQYLGVNTDSTMSFL